MRVHGLHGSTGSLGLGAVPERDQVEGPQRPSQATPEVAVVPRVLDHTDGDEGMGDLEEHGSAPAEERRDR